jgi:hypothetical protein
MKRSTSFPWKGQLKKRNRVLKSDDDPPDVAPKNKGNVIFDATACPLDIAYPTDLQMLYKSR